MKKYIVFFIAVVCVFSFIAWIMPDEGMWMLNQLEKLPWSEMQKHGLQLTPAQIYNPDSTSLKDAIILLGGGTSSFVSPEGLILTNHHVAHGAIQSLSSVEEDYLKDGFYAKTRAEELSVPSYQARVVLSQKDVTSEVLGAVNGTMSPESRMSAIRAKNREIEKREQGETDHECRVSEFYNGNKYYLFTYDVFRDVRLVYAPPTAIGNYGGEVDNWYWPRHTGDFSLMRVYVSPNGKHAKYDKNNVPYKPKVFLPISISGFKEGDFAMIVGFPGRTFRYRTAAEIELAKDETLPLTMDLYKTSMDIIEAAGKSDRALEIKFASRWRGLANTYKNYQGTLEGMRRADIMTLRHNEEKQMQNFFHSKPELEARYGTIFTDIASAYDEVKKFNRKQIVLEQLIRRTDMLGIANRFNDFANSFEQDSASGDLKPSASRLDDMRNHLKNTFKNFDLNVDKQVLTAFIVKAADLPHDQQIDRIIKIVGQHIDLQQREKAVREFVDDLYGDSKLTTPDGCEKMLSESADDIRDDAFVKFAADLDREIAPLRTQAMTFNARIDLLRSRLLEVYMAWKGPDIYPDANRTLRLTYGQIESYNPRDAVHYNYETTLTGVMEKETGTDPFIVPPKLRELWEKKDFGRYVDPQVNDVPVAFLADLDITGGNSGSPVINGKGELIGLAFDGNWEAVVGDYVFQEPLNRAINVDARYIMFILDKYSNAQNLVNELVVHDSSPSKN